MSNKKMLGGAAVAALVVFVLLAFLFVFPGGSGLADDYRYLPNKCVVVGSVQLSQIVKSQAYKDLMAEVNKLFPGKGNTQEMEKELGLAAEDIERLTFGGAGNKDSSAVVTTTKAVTAADLTAKMKDRKFSEVKVGSYTMHQEQPDYLKKAFCIVDKYTVIYGEPTPLKAILERGKKTEFSPEMQAALALANQSRSLFVAVNVKGLMASEVVKEVPLQQLGGQAASQADKVDTVALDAAVGNDVQINSVMVCKDDKFADDIRKIAEGGLTSLKYIPQAPKELVSIVEAVKITASGNQVTSTATLKPAALVTGISKMISGAFSATVPEAPKP